MAEEIVFQHFFLLKSSHADLLSYMNFMTAGSQTITKFNMTHCHPFSIHVTFGLISCMPFCLTVVLMVQLAISEHNVTGCTCLYCLLFRYLAPEEKKFSGPYTHSVLYNAMIHPFLNMTIYGAIWYQGEANAFKPYMYNCTFPTMIDDWRSKWFDGTDELTEPEFPFGFVQV